MESELKLIIEEHNIPINPKGHKEFTYINPDINSDKIYDIKMSYFFINNNNNIPVYKYFYNEDISDIVYTKFKEDFELFGFEK